MIETYSHGHLHDCLELSQNHGFVFLWLMDDGLNNDRHESYQHAVPDHHIYRLHSGHNYWKKLFF
jgi:hypothetical protein